MTAYAIGTLRDVRVGDDIVEYLRRIDATLAPFGGGFAVHGAVQDVLEGTWDGSVVVITFPTTADAHGWYRSPAYQDIVGLRTDNADSDVIIVDGCEPGHLGAELIPALTAP